MPAGPDPNDKQSKRAQAEAALALPTSSPPNQALETPESQRMSHELGLHQIELEMQADELRLAKSALDASETRYEGLYDLAPVGYCRVNDGGLIVQANRTLASLLGVTRNALARQPLFTNFVLPADQDIWYLLRKRIQKKGASQTCELRLRRAIDDAGADDRLSVWVQLTVAQAQDESGEQVLHIAVTDINERKTAEDALSRSEELVTLFLKHTPVHTFFKEVTSTESRVLRASDSFQQMIGMTAKDMEGKTMAQLFPPELAAKITADDWVVVSRGEVVTLEEELNGRHYTTIKFPIASSGRALLAGFTMDVTESKNAQETLRQQNAELTLFNTNGVERELVMIGLKQEVNALSLQLGKAAPYDVDFVDTQAIDQP